MTEAVKPPTRWLRVALVLSLSLNLLLVGLAVGSAVNFRKSGGPPRNFDISAGMLGRALSPEDRAAVAQELRRLPRVDGANRRELGEMMDGLTALLRAEPFDAAAFSAEMDRQSTLLVSVQQAGKTAMVARIAAMTPEARAEFADRIEAQARRGQDTPRRE